MLPKYVSRMVKKMIMTWLMAEMSTDTDTVIKPSEFHGKVDPPFH